MQPCPEPNARHESSSITAGKIFILLLLFLSACKTSTTPVWQWNLESRSYADPIIDGKTICVVSQAGEIILGEYETGKKLWTRKLAGQIVAAPAISSEYLFAATQEGEVAAFEKQSGNKIWTKHLEDAFSAPLTPVQDMLIVPSQNGRLFALSQINGELLWMHEGNKRYNVRAVNHGPYLFIGGWSGEFYCFRTNGTINWKFQGSSRLTEEAVVRKNTVFFPDHEDYVYAFEIPSGKLIWRYGVRNPTNLILVGEELVVGDGDTNLHVLQPNSGQLLRKINVRKRINRIYEWNQKCIVVSKNAQEIDVVRSEISPFLSAPEPIFKLAFPEGFIVATGETYSVYGYRR